MALRRLWREADTTLRVHGVYVGPAHAAILRHTTLAQTGFGQNLLEMVRVDMHTLKKNAVKEDGTIATAQLFHWIRVGEGDIALGATHDSWHLGISSMQVQDALVSTWQDINLWDNEDKTSMRAQQEETPELELPQDQEELLEVRQALVGAVQELAGSVSSAADPKGNPLDARGGHAGQKAS